MLFLVKLINKLLSFFYILLTVEVMIMSRYRFGPYVTDRYCFQGNVNQRDINVTDRYRPLLIVTEFYRYLRYKRYRSKKGLLNRYLKFYKIINVTLVTFVTKATVTGQNHNFYCIF